MRLEHVADNYERLPLCLTCLEALAGPATSGQGRNFLPRTECRMCFCGPIFCDMAATVRQKARLPVMGQSRRFDPRPATSDQPQSTDINRPARLVRFVPTAVIPVSRCRRCRCRAAV